MRETDIVKISTVSTDPISCTVQTAVLSYSDASRECSWVLAMFIMVFSERTAKGLESGGAE